MYNNTISQNAKSIVLSFISDLNSRDFAMARKYVDHKLKFHGMDGEETGANAYFDSLQQMMPEYDVRNIFCEGEDVCLVYNFRVQGIVVFGCGLYHVKNNKIDCLKVVFDPRPLLKLKEQA